MYEDYCSMGGTHGLCISDPVLDGTLCDDGEPCLTVEDICMEGVCGGNQIQIIECTTHADCEALTQGYGSCGPTGYCTCIPAECDPPTVVAEGPRYIAVMPPEEIYSVAIRVNGMGMPVSCVEAYVQDDGRLRQPNYDQGEAAEDYAEFQRTGSTGWGIAHVRGEGIVGGSTYEIRLDCDPDNPGTFLSPPVTGTTASRADVGGPFGPDGNQDFVDISMVVDGFRGDWGTPVCCTTDDECAVFGPLSLCNTDWPGCEKPVQTPGRCKSRTENLDLIGTSACEPDRVIDFVDLTAAVEAFRQVPDRCGVPCPVK